MNSDSGTRSTTAATPRIVGIRKANTLDYLGEGVKTRSEDEGAEVYELELLNLDATRGYAVVGDEKLANEVFAYSPVGSIADTTYNEGLALYFKELAAVTAAVAEAADAEPTTRTGGGSGTIDEDDIWETGWDATANCYEPVGDAELVRITTVSELIQEGEVPMHLFRYDPIHRMDVTSSYLRTKWSQGNPYNKYVDRFTSTGERKSVGCYPVAMGQLMAYQRQSSFDYDWDLISIKDTVETVAEQNEVARLLWNIAQRAGTYWDAGSNKVGHTDIADIIPGIKSEGYSVREVVINSAQARKDGSAQILNEIRLYNRPVLYDAQAPDPNGTDSKVGHIWVVDGILEQYRWYNWIVQSSETTPSNIVIEVYRQLKRGRLHHCNWGWGGKSDGWYFDFSAVPAGVNLNFAHPSTYSSHLYLGIEFIDYN